MKYFLSFLLVMILGNAANAQEFKIDFNLRGSSVGILDFGDGESTSLGYNQSLVTPEIAASAEIVYFPLSFVGVGVFHNRTVLDGENGYESLQSYNSYYEDITKYSVSMYGVSAQLTTSRKKPFRIYVVGRVGKYEMVEDFGGFSIASNGLVYSGGFGVMLKLSRRLSFNIFEANYLKLSNEFNSERNENAIGAQVQSGLSFKFYRKK